MSTPQPQSQSQTKREVPFDEAMSRAVEAEAVDEEQMRSLLPPKRLEEADAEVEMPVSTDEEA